MNSDSTGSPSADQIYFPPGFLWGVSTSSHQNEGSNANNQWAAWEAQGRVRTGERAGQACDWWNYAERDLDLAQQMGLNALRISLEWSRIEPRPGEWDESALTRYRQILHALKLRGIRPFVCLHHFTNPGWLEERGAFENPHTVALFSRYAHKALEALGDLCDDWLTFNEPNVYAVLGYQFGEFPPGRKGDFFAAIKVLTTMAQAHSAAYDVIHLVHPGARVGWTNNYLVFEAADPSSAFDRRMADMQSYLYNEPFLELLQYGSTSGLMSLACAAVPEARGKYDFVGFNVYGRVHVAFDVRQPGTFFGKTYVPSDVPQGDASAQRPFPETYPAAIGIAADRFATFGKPIFIFENGVPDREDRFRPSLIVNALREVNAALLRRIDLRGYFHWTLTDNFEWSQGWDLRFGLVELDRPTQARKIRRSGHLLGAIARNNSLTPAILAEHAPELLLTALQR